MFQLSSQPIVTFVPTRDPERARHFYGGQLGLRLVGDELPFALVYDVNGTMLRVAVVREHTPAGYTVLGWQVSDIEGAAQALHARGITFERYPGFQQDSHGIWTAPDGSARVAWFRDPDGNILSLSQHRSRT